jgi:FlaA1/EpsC-like NDP-sugar epimerase
MKTQETDHQIQDLPSAKRYYKQMFMLCVDFVLLSAALLFALWARVGEVWLPDNAGHYAVLVTCLLLSLFAFIRLGLYRSIIRYMGQQAIFAVMQGVSLSALIISMGAFMSDQFMPRSVPVIYWCFAYVFIGGSRMVIRAYYHKSVQIHRERVAIYGAGTSGLQVYKALIHGKEHKPVIFIDDNLAKHGMLLDGLPVYGSKNLAILFRRYGINKVLLAMPSVSMQRRQEIMLELSTVLPDMAVQMVPGIEDLLDQSFRGADVGRVYDDILGRAPVAPDETLLHQCIRDRVVMVSGAAGSIGGELCRQILVNRPKQLLLVDVNEYGLYKIEQELRITAMNEGIEHVELVSMLGNVLDMRRMLQIMQAFSVETIYHAAAYKHVPIVENNVIEGVRNNVLGTWSLVRAAAEASVGTFVLISTDKAVRPASVMGASKRFAELICQAYASSETRTRYCMVRFGNVLGSSGSVVPLFFDQINAGGPVTVTHSEVTRYFMTLSEAAQLVLQAGSMGRGGEVFVLDMGKQVRIVELAQRMITLMGHTLRDEKTPQGDIEMVFTGLRPGEKMHEELVISENTFGTSHPMIMQADDITVDVFNLLTCLDRLQVSCNEGDCVAVTQLLKEVVGEFVEGPLSDKVWQRERSQGSVQIISGSNVTPLTRRSNPVR